MEDYQDRVMDEKIDLDAKIVALTQFIHSNKFRPIKKVEQERMYAQLHVMLSYSAILRERIDGFFPISFGK